MNSKRKGNAGELELLHILEQNDIDAVRNDQMYIGGKNNPDISARIADDQFHIEVKRVEKLNLNQAMQQAISDASETDVPCVVHRSNRNPWLVTLRLSDAIKMINKGHSAERSEDCDHVNGLHAAD